MGRGPPTVGWRPTRAHCTDPVCTKAQAWEQARFAAGDPLIWQDTQDPDQYFADLEKVLEAYHQSLYGNDARLTQRIGKISRQQPDRHIKEGCEEGKTAARSGRRHRRLAELAKVWPPSGPLPKHGADIRAALPR